MTTAKRTFPETLVDFTRKHKWLFYPVLFFLLAGCGVYWLRDQILFLGRVLLRPRRAVAVLTAVCLTLTASAGSLWIGDSGALPASGGVSAQLTTGAAAVVTTTGPAAGVFLRSAATPMGYIVEIPDGGFAGKVAREADGAEIRANGDSDAWESSGGTYLQLMPLECRSRGSAFTSTPVPVDAGLNFSTHFTFSLSGDKSEGSETQIADGFCFALMPATDNVGGNASGLGYANVAHSVAIEFDVYDNASNSGDTSASASSDVNKKNGSKAFMNGTNHIAVNRNGSLASPLGFTNVMDVPFYCGETFSPDAKRHVWIEYNGAAKLLAIRVSATAERPAEPTAKAEIDLAAVIGQDHFYPGFTASTGYSASQMVIHEWQFANGYYADGLPTSGYRVTGSVKDENDVALSGATVTLTKPLESAPAATGMTDLNGQFSILGVAPGDYIAAAFGPDGSSAAEIPVTVGEDGSLSTPLNFAISAVAKIGDTLYPSLAAAFDVFDTAQEGGTIELLRDVTLTKAIWHTSKKAVTLTSAEGPGAPFTIRRGFCRYGQNNTRDGSLLIVGFNGSELTLKNIVLDGQKELAKAEENYGALAYVYSGGRLILDEGSRLCNNWSAERGAGVCLKEIVTNGGGGHCVLRGGTVSDNESRGDGGGFYLSGACSLLVESGTISGNAAGSDGGGIYSLGGSLQVEGGTISGNAAGIDGGGIGLFSGESFAITGGTVIGNTAVRDGGGITANSGLLQIGGDVQVTGNQAANAPENVYLNQTGGTMMQLQLIAPLGENAEIGVTVDNRPKPNAPSTIAVSGDAYSITEEDAKRFTSDSDRYWVRHQTGAVQLMAYTYRVGLTTTASGTLYQDESAPLLAAVTRIEDSSVARAGSVEFYLGAEKLGAGSYDAEAGGFPFQLPGSALAAGDNQITARYVDADGNSFDSGPLTVTASSLKNGDGFLAFVPADSPRYNGFTEKALLGTFQLSNEGLGAGIQLEDYTIAWKRGGSSVPSNELSYTQEGGVYASRPGEYEFTAELKTDTGYVGTLSGTVSMAKRRLTLTPKDVAIWPGETPEFDYSLEGDGLAAGDTISDVTYTTTANGDYTNPGLYSISLGEMTLTNADCYEVSKETGSLTIRELRTVDLRVYRDGAPWANHGKAFRLSGDGGGTFFPLDGVRDGTYALYEGNTDTGITVTVNGAGAQARIDYYTVTFHSAFATQPQTVQSGAMAVDPGLVRAGYTLEWKTAEVGGSVWDFTANPVTAPVNLYAVWTATPLTLRPNSAELTLTVGTNATAEQPFFDLSRISVEGDATEGGTVRYRLKHAGGLPAGLQLEESTGRLIGTPESVCAIPLPITIVVTGRNGAEAEFVLRLTVNPIAVEQPPSPAPPKVLGNRLVQPTLPGQAYACTTQPTPPAPGAESWIVAPSDSLEWELEPNTDYYIWTYRPGDSTHSDSPVSQAAVVTTGGIAYPLKVTGGQITTGAAFNEAGASVMVTADPPAAGRRFREWRAVGLAEAVYYESPLSFQMPANGVTLVAVYEDSDLGGGSAAVRLETGSPDTPPADLADSQRVLDMVLSPDERQEVENGATALVILRISKLPEDHVDAEEKRLLADALGERTLETILDVSLWKQINGADQKRITQTNRPIRITIVLPPELRGSGKRFTVLLVHGDKTFLLPDLDNNPDTVTFETQLFSTYALTYTAAPAGNGTPASIAQMITASAGPGGDISPSGTVTVREGGSLTFHVVPDEGYRVDRVLVDGRETVLEGNAYTFRDVWEAHRIEVTFAVDDSGAAAEQHGNGKAPALPPALPSPIPHTGDDPRLLWVGLGAGLLGLWSTLTALWLRRRERNDSR